MDEISQASEPAVKGTAEPGRSFEAGNVGIAVAADEVVDDVAASGGTIIQPSSWPAIVGPEAVNPLHVVVGPEAMERAKEVVVPAPTPIPQRPLTQNDSVKSWEEARPGKATEKVDDACPANAGGDQLMPQVMNGNTTRQPSESPNLSVESSVPSEESARTGKHMTADCTSGSAGCKMCACGQNNADPTQSVRRVDQPRTH